MCLQSDNRQRRVRDVYGQTERLRRTVQQVQQGGGPLMFWGGIMWGNHIGRISRGINLKERLIVALIVHVL